MPGPKTNEREGTRAVLRHSRQSAWKVREVLDLIRGKDVGLAAEILRFSERDAARTVGKLLASAVANAENNDLMDPEELYVSACFADEGPTAKRWRPRARGRPGRIRKRTCHVTVIVSRLPEDRLERMRAMHAADMATRRARRVAGQRQSEGRARRTRGGRAEDAAVEELDDVVEAEEAEGIVDATGAAVVEAAAGMAEAEAESAGADDEGAVEAAAADAEGGAEAKSAGADDEDDDDVSAETEEGE